MRRWEGKRKGPGRLREQLPDPPRRRVSLIFQLSWPQGSASEFEMATLW